MGMTAYPDGSPHHEPLKYVVIPSQPHTCGPTEQATPGVTGTHTPIAEQPPDSLYAQTTGWVPADRHWSAALHGG
jgi:hypothetical protein